ncbi:immunoglobulin-like domain-containing protein [Stigmatella hybrida]|uniref:immunoglobulin-like domain-containing protein n=1 Tax=Stigmatella hybrida TaxID=394097 RepID=UPI001CDAE563|nr:immunoglobulin-like domain-containing protein [Stigmatella hybrida]
MLILGTTVTGGQSSREAQAAANLGYPATVVTPEQWRAMTPEQFQEYAGIIIGDAACQGGESAFQAAVDNRNIWGAAVDGNVVISGSDATNNGTPQFIENVVSSIVASHSYLRTGMYVSLGCAYQDATPGTPVPLLEPFGSFTVAGTGCHANGAHIFRMFPEALSDGLYGNDGALNGTRGCATRVVFSGYPDKTFVPVAIAVDESGFLPNSREYWDFLMEDPDSFKTFIGTPYVLTQSAMAYTSGCGQGSEPTAMCDQSSEGNGKPATPGTPADFTCSFSCQQQWCGDGHVDAEHGEECDDGLFNGRTRDHTGAIGSCTTFCKIPNFDTESPPDALCKNLELVADLTCGADGNVNNGSWDPDEDLVGCQQSPIGPYGPGTTTVTLTCTDLKGNTDSCTATITVLDQNKPSLTLVGSNEQIECSPGPYTDPGATAADVCEGDLTGAIAVSGTVNPGAVGQYELTYNVEDSSGNAATPVKRTVTVSDTLPPTLALNGTAPQALECGSPYVDPGATALDACASDLTGAITRSGEVNPNVPNAYTVIYNVLDPSGQSAPSVTRQVNVSDTLAPVITVQGPTSDTFECGGEYTDPGATANDQCYGNLTSAVIATRTTVPGQPGNFTITYSVQDPAGNVATSPVTRTVKVNDDLPPSIALNGEVYVTVECSEPFVDPGAKAVDLCAGDVPVTVSGTVDTTRAGNYVLSYSAQDRTGNTSATVTRTVQVNDSLPPAITLLGENPMSLECKRDTYVEPGATAFDLCSGSSTVVSSENIDESVPGYYAVNYTATDKSGRQSTAIRDVNVVDTLPPAFETPAPLTLECAIDALNEPLPKLIDLCKGDITANVIREHHNVDLMHVGNYSIRYQGNDFRDGGAPVYVDRDVQVRDTVAPVITLKGPPSDTYECGGQYIDPGATAADACAGDLTGHIVATRSPVPGQPGSFTITYSVQDPSGNKAVAPATRMVREGGIQVRLSDFNVFLFEDYTLGSDVEGRVAAGGNISMKHFSVGWELPSSDTAPVLVAGGNLSLTQGGVWGDAAYGGTYSASNVTYVRGAPSKSTPVDFPTRAAEVRKLSTQLDSLPTNGLTRREAWGGLMLTGSSADVNVFSVNASDLSSTVLLSIDAPAGSLAVLNIHGTSAKLAGGHVFSGGIDQQGVLFNFVDATSINAQGYGLWGTLLAPNAHVNFTNGSFDGGIYAKSLSGNAEGHLNPLRERVICNGPSFIAQLGGE